MIGFRTDLSRTIAPQLIFQREAARTVPEMRTAHYFSIRNLRLSKKFPAIRPARGCTRIAPKIKSTSTIALDPPINFKVSTQY